MSARGVHETLPVMMAMMNHHLEAASRTRPRALGWPTFRFSEFLRLEETIRNAEGETRGRRQASGIMRALPIAIPRDGASWSYPSERQCHGGLQGAGQDKVPKRYGCSVMLTLQEAGCLALVLEGIPAELAKRATGALTIPQHRNWSRAKLLRPGARTPRRLWAARR